MYSQLILLACATLASAQTYKASFTEYVFKPFPSASPSPKNPPLILPRYGAGDTFGSSNCNTATAACGFYNYPGYNAAASQALFGVGPGAGAGPACGTCWRLTAQTDSSGKALSGASSIIVRVNNLCPADGNPLCSQSSLTDTNQYGMLYWPVLPC